VCCFFFFFFFFFFFCFCFGVFCSVEAGHFVLFCVISCCFVLFCVFFSFAVLCFVPEMGDAEENQSYFDRSVLFPLRAYRAL